MMISQKHGYKQNNSRTRRSESKSLKSDIIKISTSVRDSQDINWPQSIKFSNYHSPLYLRVKEWSDHLCWWFISPLYLAQFIGQYQSLPKQQYRWAQRKPALWHLNNSWSWYVFKFCLLRRFNNLHIVHINLFYYVYYKSLYDLKLDFVSQPVKCDVQSWVMTEEHSRGNGGQKLRSYQASTGRVWEQSWSQPHLAPH